MEELKENPTETRIGEQEAREALATLEKYKRGKKTPDERLIDNEQWWKMRHWERFKRKTRTKKP